ncbi:peroxidase family protein [Pseudonocardia sp. CA-142604]|uniref:peroxidase family protein n=1 Tax=Pseudonocardia sp. CA-142604 TaxID=3240024 RepID=UPI003D919691
MTQAPELPREDVNEPVPAEQPLHLPRVLTNLSHGGHVAGDDVNKVDPNRDPDDSMRWARVRATSTPFGYMFDKLRGVYPAAHLPVEPSAGVVASLKALGTAMAEQPGDPTGGDSDIPPIYTYWGQFVDHDLTANTDRDEDISITEVPFEPLRPEKVMRDLRNLRQPRLNLDSVYGHGPASSGQQDQVPYTGHRLVIGPLTPASLPGQAVLPGADLPRVDKKAQIGDGRNDENLIVAQLHLGFLKFHNAVLDWFAANPTSHVTGDGSFERARQLVEWHYQWITVHDFLKRIAQPEVVDDLLNGRIEPRLALSTNTPQDEVFMPLEFSVAAYRFGHSMVRAAYDWNINFGVPENGVLRAPSSPFELLFLFTGGGGFADDAPTLPDNWPAQFERLTGFELRPDGTDEAVPVRCARKIDTHLAPPLADLLNEGEGQTSDRIKRILKRLAVRNLLRGYRLAIPTGQAVARTLGVEPLSEQELIKDTPPPSPLHDALVDGGFIEETPLWFYVLKEAEVLEQGDRLGPVGSRIVAETILGQLRADPTSFVNQNWDPTQGVTTGPADTDVVDSIITFLRFAGMHT